MLSAKRPDLAIRHANGGRWLNHAGLGWSNPYDQRVWDYNVDIAEAAARAGFDEIQFDYVRFPSDGDMRGDRLPGQDLDAAGLGDRAVRAVRVEAAEAARRPGLRRRLRARGDRDLGIGQVPKRIGRYLDAIYPMVYPRTSGRASTTSTTRTPNPGATVAYALRDFNRELAGTKGADHPLAPGLLLGRRTYALADVQAQIDSARRAKAGGYLLWNAAGIYTPGARRARPLGRQLAAIHVFSAPASGRFRPWPRHGRSSSGRRFPGPARRRSSSGRTR